MLGQRNSLKGGENGRGGRERERDEKNAAWSSAAVAICCGSATAAATLDLELPTTAKETKINKSRASRREGREGARDEVRQRRGAGRETQIQRGKVQAVRRTGRMSDAHAVRWIERGKRRVA